jgi:hypothetical protein
MMESEMTSEQLIKMMSKPINSKGITGNDLAFQDETFRSIFNRALSDRRAEHKAVEERDNQIAIDKKSQAVDSTRSALLSDPNMSDQELMELYISNGGSFDKAGQMSTFVENTRKDAAGLGKGFASPEASQLKHLIAVSSGNLNEAELKSAMLNLGIAQDTLSEFTKLNGTEKSQFKEALAHINSTNIASKKIFSIIGKSLKPESSKAIFAKLARGETLSDEDLNEFKESMVLSAFGVANGVTAQQLTEALVLAQPTLAKINKLATDTAADAAINNISPNDIDLTPFAIEVEDDIKDLLEIITGDIKGKTSTETSSQGTPSSPTAPQEKPKAPEPKRAEGETKVAPIVKIPSIQEQSIRQTELQKRITDGKPLSGLVPRPMPLDEQKYLETIVPTKIHKSAYDRVVEHNMALVAPIMGSIDELGKFVGGSIDELGKFVGGSIDDIGSAVNSFMSGTQISDALKNLGPNYDSFFNDSMTTILKGVNAVADVISSDAEGSTKADKLAPQLREPKIEFPEEKGKDVVKQAVSVVTRLKLGSEEHGFLERIAQHESLNGEHPGTFSNKNGKPYHGGIFQVDEIGFKDTQNTTSHPNLKKKYAIIKKELGIDWTKVKWEDLRKPLYSALAARLLLTLALKPIPKDRKEQAVYWKDNFNKSGKGTPEIFLKSNPK